MRFQEMTSHALATNYGADDLFDKYGSLRLPTIIVQRNNNFSEKVEKIGHTYSFDSDTPTASEELAASVKSETTEADSERSHSDVRTVENYPELSDVTCDSGEPVSDPVGKGILAWLTGVYTNSRGFELGTFDSSLLAITMKRQSSKWNALALGYINDVVTLTHGFIVNLLHEICPDKRVSSALLSLLMDGLVETYKRAIDHVHFILQVERTETPLTLNHYFNDNLEKRYV